MNGAAIDMRLVYSDPAARPFMRDRRVDLLAPPPLFADGEFIVYDNVTEKGTIEIVRSVAPYAMERTDIGTPQESLRKIDTLDGDGFFVFTPRVNGQVPFTLEVDYNAPRVAAGPFLNGDRQRATGISHLSPWAWVNGQQYNPLFAFALPSKVQLQITFSLLPPAVAAGIPNPYQIGVGAKRVDFAGVLVTGVKMPQTRYDDLMQQEQARK